MSIKRSTIKNAHLSIILVFIESCVLIAISGEEKLHIV